MRAARKRMTVVRPRAKQIGRAFRGEQPSRREQCPRTCWTEKAWPTTLGANAKCVNKSTKAEIPSLPHTGSSAAWFLAGAFHCVLLSSGDLATHLRNSSRSKTRQSGKAPKILLDQAPAKGPLNQSNASNASDATEAARAFGENEKGELRTGRQVGKRN